MSKRLFVGIDVSSRNNVVCFCGPEGNQLFKPTTFSNNLPGAEALTEKIAETMQNLSLDTVLIGTEATGIYDLHIADYLASNPILARYSTSVFRFNPKVIRGFKKSYPERDKTDIIDAFVIAERLRFGHLPEPYTSEQCYLPLRRLTRYRFHLVKTIVREKSCFLNNLFLKYSALGKVKPFSQVFGHTSLAMIEEFFSPDEIAATPVGELIKFIISHGKDRTINPQKVAEDVRRAARESYRLRPALADSVNLILSSILQNIRALTKSLKEIDRAIAREFQAFPNTLQSIPGMGPVYSAGIFSEIGQVNRFSSEDKIAKLAGLAWRKRQSGKFIAEETRMIPGANKYLRYYLVQAANALRVHNAEYKSFYKVKYEEVTKHQHKRALVLTARKLVRLVSALLKKRQLYFPEHAREKSLSFQSRTPALVGAPDVSKR